MWCGSHGMFELSSEVEIHQLDKRTNVLYYDARTYVLFSGMEAVMQVSAIQRGVFDHQADRIEKVLSALDLPTRVQGGQVGQDRIRYHLAPVSNTLVHQVSAMSGKLAEAMGVYKVYVDEEEDGLVLDLLIEDDAHLRLIPLIMESANPLPVTSIVGISTQGKPLLINFRRSESWHLGIFTPYKTGKSELLRTLIFSLALCNRPSQLQFLGIDFSGKELSVIDALPHLLTQVANDQMHAEEIIQWVVEEIYDRKTKRVIYPDIFLVIDQLETVMDHSDLLQKNLPFILHEGPLAGVHLMIASKKSRPGTLLPHWRKSGVVSVKPVNDRKRKVIVGQFEFQMPGEKMHAQVAWLPAKDLQQATTMVQTGWRSTRSSVDIKKLWQ